MKDLYTKTYKTSLKEIKEDLNKWKDTPCLWTGRLNIIKMVILANVIYRFNVIPIKIPITFLFAEMEKPILEFTWNCKGPWIAKIIFKKNNKVGGLILPDLKSFYKAIVTKTVWYWHKDSIYTTGIKLRIQK